MENESKPDYIDVTLLEANLITAELKAVMAEAGVGVVGLLGIYRVLWEGWRESGGCDHSTGICWCETARTLDMLARKLGWPQPVEAWGYVIPKPEDLYWVVVRNYEVKPQ